MTTPNPPVRKDALTPLRKFVNGFLAEARPTMPPIDNPNIGGVGTEDDLREYASEENIVRQRQYDLNQEVAETEADPVRTISGVLDFLGGVGEEILDMVAHGEEKLPPPKEPPYVLRTFDAAANSWRAQVFYPQGETIRIARKSNDRVTLEIVNLGPEVIYLTDESGGPVGRVPNSRAVPISKLDGTGPYSPVRINHQQEVWCRTTTGTVPVQVEVTETFGAPEKEVF